VAIINGEDFIFTTTAKEEEVATVAGLIALWLLNTTHVTPALFVFFCVLPAV
jgi:hypothetical protein